VIGSWQGVDTKVMETLEHKGFMSPQHLIAIDTMLTMPGATLEAEYQRWRVHMFSYIENAL
jgi:hypothetical protein